MVTNVKGRRSGGPGHSGNGVDEPEEQDRSWTGVVAAKGNSIWVCILLISTKEMHLLLLVCSGGSLV